MFHDVGDINSTVIYAYRSQPISGVPISVVVVCPAPGPSGLVCSPNAVDRTGAQHDCPEQAGPPGAGTEEVGSRVEQGRAARGPRNCMGSSDGSVQASKTWAFREIMCRMLKAR